MSTSSANRQAPATTGLLSLVKTVHFAWFVGHVLALVGGLNYALFSLKIFKSASFPLFWYRESYIATIATFAIILQQGYFTGSKRVDLISLIKDDNVHYMLLATLWLFSKPFTLSLPPYMVFSLFHAVGFLKNNLLPTLNYSTSSALYKRLDHFYRTYNDPSLMFASTVEFLNFLSMMGAALTFRRAALVPFTFYALFMKLRYEQSAFTRNVVHAWEVRLDGLFGHSVVPPVIRQVWINFKLGIRQYVGGVRLLGRPAVKKTQ